MAPVVPTLLALLIAVAAPLAAQDSAKAQAAALLAKVNAMETHRPGQALQAAWEGLKLAREQADPALEAAFASSVAYCSSQTGDLVQAIQYANEALTLSTRLGDRERQAKAHNILGISYTFMGAYGKALDEGLEALRIREELGLEGAVMQSMNLVGVIYHHAGQYEKAIETYQRILDRLGSRPEPARRILANLNLGLSELKLGRLAEARRREEAALALALATPGAPYLPYAYLNLGMTCTEQRDYGKARAYLDQALAGYREHDQKHGLVQALNALGRLDLLTGRLDSGVSLAEEGAALAARIKAQDELKTSYELLSSLHERRGDIAKSLASYKRFAAIKDSIFTTQESEKIADFSMRLVTLKKDHQIGALKAEGTIAALKLQKERYLRLLLSGGVATLSLLMVALAFGARRARGRRLQMQAANRRLHALNRELQEKIGEVKTLTGLLPICAKCKNIRDDDGYWQQLEGYLADHTQATFSHGICPTCAEELYPEVVQARRTRPHPAEEAHP